MEPVELVQAKIDAIFTQPYPTESVIDNVIKLKTDAGPVSSDPMAVHRQDLGNCFDQSKVESV